MRLPRIPASHRKHLAFHDSFVQIEFQKPCCCLTLRGKGFDHSASDRKMHVPTFPPRIKQANKLACASVQGTDVAPLPHVASQASIREIVRNRRPSVFPADDVVDLMRRIGIFRVQQAVLASVAGTFGNQLPKLVRNVTCQDACAVVPWPSP